MDKKITAKQHYIPRFYMKNFAITKQTKKEVKAFISFYQFDKALYKNNIPTKDICYKNYFYGKDGIIEKELSNKETEWSKTIHGIVNDPQKELKLDDIKNLKEFSIYQLCRTVATLTYGKSVMNTLLIKHLSNCYTELDEDTIAKLVTTKTDNEIQASILIEICDKLVKELDDLEVGIIQFATSHKLITSDMPVIVINPFSMNVTGLINIGTVIMYPISPNTLVIIYDSKVYTSCCNFMINNNEQDVITLNKYQILSAENMIMSIDNQSLSEIVAQSDVIQKRKDFIERKKINSVYNGKDTFFAIRPRNIPYEYLISLFNLPKNIQKIPLECRETFPRKYDYKSHLNLLCRIYRLPDVLKFHKCFSSFEICEQIKGYKRLLQFMYDYWETPASERTITPELMYKLKTVPVREFNL